MILKLRHDSGFVHLRAADRRSVPAVKAVAVARRRRQFAVSIAGKNRSAAYIAFVQRTAVGVEGHGMCSPGLFHGQNQRRRYGELIHRCPREGQRIGSGWQIGEGERGISTSTENRVYALVGNPAAAPCHRTFGRRGGRDGKSGCFQGDRAPPYRCERVFIRLVRGFFYAGACNLNVCKWRIHHPNP